MPYDSAVVPDVDPADLRGMSLLAAHVPLTLLLDLARQPGPPSEEILRDEVDTSDWLRVLHS